MPRRFQHSIERQRCSILIVVHLRKIIFGIDIGHTRGSDSGAIAFPVAHCALELAAVTALSEPPRNARRLITSAVR